MNYQEHVDRHKELHRALDELLADWFRCCPNSRLHSEVFELVRWSFEQTKRPTEMDEMLHVEREKPK